MGRNGRADVAAIGDSNTLLSYLPPWSRLRWTALVADRLGLRVADFGRDGGTLRQALDDGTFDRALATRASDYLISFGINDSIRVTLEDFESDLREAIDRITAPGGRPYLLTNVWLDYPDHCSTDQRNREIGPFDDVIRKVAADLDVPLIDVNQRLRDERAAGTWDVRIRNGAIDASLDGGRSVESKWWDNVHYNPAACRIVADEVLRALGS